MRRPGGAGSTARSCAARVQRAIERRDVDVRPLDARLEDLGDAANLALPGQEDKHRAAFARERIERDARDLVLDPDARAPPDIARRNGEGAPLALDQRRVAQERAHPRAVERRRHDEKAQVLAQRALRVESQREPEIGVERALVELVEQHRRDALERGIVEDHAGEHALGDDLDPRPRRDEALQAHTQADGLADLFAERRGHARRGGARGEAARLEDDELFRPGPRLLEERERDARRLARAGRGDQHGARMCGERGAKRRQRVVDRQRRDGVGHHAPPAWRWRARRRLSSATCARRRGRS